MSVLTPKTKQGHAGGAQAKGENQRLGLGHLALRERPAPGAAHDGIDACVENVIDGSRRRSRQADARSGQHEDVQRNHAGHGQEHAHDGGKHDQRNDPELAQPQVIAEPVRERSAQTRGLRISLHARPPYSN